MRGAGKTFAGRVAASTLGWPLIDSDLYFQDRHQMRITDYVQEYGWENFRREEGTILKEILQKSSTGHVISLGGGIVETEDGRALLKSHKGPVIQINRDMEEIVSYLHEDSLRPSLGEPIETIWKRRQPWLLDCSNSEFYNLEASADPATQVTMSSVPCASFSILLRVMTRITLCCDQAYARTLSRLPFLPSRTRDQ